MFWTTWISLHTHFYRFIFLLIYLTSWHEPLAEKVTPWLKVLKVTFRMNSAFVCAHIQNFLIFTMAQRASCAWWTGGINLLWVTAGGSTQLLLHTRLLSSRSANVPSRWPPPLPSLWLNSYFLIISILLLLFCSLSRLLFDGCFTLLCEHVGIGATSFPKNAVCGNNKPAD